MSDKNKGVNSSGNQYTSYGDGRYTYKNVNSDGKTESRFYDAGNGHSFYKKTGPDGYTFHENANKGFREYNPGKGSSSKQGEAKK